MQNSKEEQGEIRKPSSAMNTKNQRKMIEQERLEVTQENQKHQGNISFKDEYKKKKKENSNDMNLTETEDIKRWQKYTEELYKNRSS